MSTSTTSRPPGDAAPQPRRADRATPRSIAVWVLVALVGATCWVVLALSRGESGSALWILDAESCATIATLAFAAGALASFADLARDQISRERLVGLGRGGAYELHWRRAPSGVPGLRDARLEIERTLGRLP